MSTDSTPSASSSPTPPAEQPAPTASMMPTAEDLRGARGLWRRFQERRAAGRSRPATDDATDSEPDGLPDPPAEYPHRSLVDRTPFQIGFFGAFGALVAIGLVTAVIALQSVIMMVVMALFLALGLNPPTEALKRRGVPSSIAVAITSLGLFWSSPWVSGPCFR